MFQSYWEGEKGVNGGGGDGKEAGGGVGGQGKGKGRGWEGKEYYWNI